MAGKKSKKEYFVTLENYESNSSDHVQSILIICRFHIYKFIYSPKVICNPQSNTWASLVPQTVESACNAGDLGSIPGLGRFPLEGNGKLTSVFLSGKFHGQRSLAGYSPWGCKGSDTTERLTLSLSLKAIFIILFSVVL